MTMLRAAKFLSICLAITAAIAAVVGFVQVRRAVNEALANSRSRLESADTIRYERNVLAPITSPRVRVIQAARRTRDLAAFRDGYAAATDGGLLLLGQNGELQKHLTILDGLPDSDLTSLAMFGDLLFIGTRTAGLVSYDGSRFEAYRLHADNTSAVTALLNTGNKLLIGTFGGGVIEYDGHRFKKVVLENEVAINVSVLAEIDDRLYAGTFDRGLIVRYSGTTRWLTNADGLPSNRVTGVVESEGRIYIATDLGFGVIENDTFNQLEIIPALSGIAVHGGQLILSRENGELLSFDKQLSILAESNVAEGAVLKSTGESIWQLSNKGVFAIEHGLRKPFGPDHRDELTDNFVSAIAFDSNDDVWIGTFRDGIDVLDQLGRRVRHVETDETRQINYLGVENGKITAATAAGIFDLQAGIKPEPLFAQDIFPSGAVMHFTRTAIATGSGLAIRDGGRLRMISGVNGLPSNSTYTSLEHDGSLYVGTMNGLAQIEDLRVTRTFDDSNSGLTTNWVTALCKADERLFIGTYGGGIFELTTSGEIRSFEPETGKFVVNINAIYADGERLYAGTLDGVRVLDLRSQKWSRRVRELPARIVMAISGHGDSVYFGTTNGIARIEKAYFEKPEE